MDLFSHVGRAKSCEMDSRCRVQSGGRPHEGISAKFFRRKGRNARDPDPDVKVQQDF